MLLSGMFFSLSDIVISAGSLKKALGRSERSPTQLQFERREIRGSGPDGPRCEDSVEKEDEGV